MIIVVVVVAGVGRYLWNLVQQWRQSEAHGFLRLRWPFALAAIPVYALGLCAYALFWRRLLHAVDVNLTAARLLRAYFVGTLGKYVPGKAMVLVLRSGLVPAAPGGRFPVVLSVFYETVMQMAAGGLVALVALSVPIARHPLFVACGALIFVALGAVLHPALLRRVSTVLSWPLGGSLSTGTPQAWFRAAWRGLPLVTGGWLLSGLALWAVLASVTVVPATLDAFALAVGAAALATSAGFLVLFMPSGIGVREFILVELLSPVYGAGPAVAAALVLRTAVTIAELVLAGAFYFFVRDARGTVEPTAADRAT